MKYYELKKIIQKEINDFVESFGFFAFSEKQFTESKARLNINDDAKIVRLFSGVYLLKEKAKDFESLLIESDKELKDKLLNDKELLKDAFIYELGNHEYCITYDITDTIDALPFTLKEIKENELLKNTLLEAKKQYLQEVEY